jgi:hypothetical protein
VRRSSILFLFLLVSFALLPEACTQNFDLFQPSGATGTSSSSSSSSSGSPGCTKDTDCLDTNACTHDACVVETGKCTNTGLADGMSPEGFTDGQNDCHTEQCMGGKQVTVNADGEIPDDQDPCTTDSCSGGMEQHPFAPANTVCGMASGHNLICDTMGNCVGCTADTDCNDPGQCGTRTCDGMQTCQFGQKAAHTTCSTGVCDGSGACIGCIDGTDCTATTHGVCENNNCIDQCKDMQTNGTETDVDCGGPTCDKCGDNQDCMVDNDCQSGFCNQGSHKCKMPTCNDNTLNGLETDTDCGGATCDAVNKTCADGKSCKADGDCTNGNCFMNMTCVSCMDQAQDGLETDVDCGGADCDAVNKKCGDNKKCGNGADCSSGNCYHTGGGAGQKTCHGTLCQDGAKDGTETDIDCGGTCSVKCADGKGCNVSGDCTSNHCSGAGGTCLPVACFNTTKDGAETDVDCGGGTCPKCATGKACAASGDCTSTFCSTMGTSQCEPNAGCADGVVNNAETDKDCGGGTCNKCIYAKTCAANTDCASGLCDVGGTLKCQCNVAADCPAATPTCSAAHVCM